MRNLKCFKFLTFSGYVSQNSRTATLDQEYQKLFGPNGNVPTAISSYDIDVQRFVDFRNTRNVPEAENVDHFALLLLTASW